MSGNFFDIAESAARRLSSMFDMPIGARLSSGPGEGGTPRLTSGPGIGENAPLRYSSLLSDDGARRFAAWDMVAQSRFNARQAGQQAGQNAAAAVGQGQRPMGLPNTGGGGSQPGFGGNYGAHEKYRAWIEHYAREFNIDPDALAAMLRIETPSGDPSLTSHAGAMGLAQVMPGTWAGLARPGDDPYNPEHSIRAGAKYFAEQFSRFGDYGLAAAAYQGGPGAIVDGKPRDDISDGNLTPAGYAALWTEYYQAIKSQQRQPAPSSGGSYSGNYNGLFGDASFGLSQPFNAHEPGLADVYDFGAEMGMDGDGHTGWDIATPHGTAFYMPRGLTGVVTIAGGSGYYRDEPSGNAPGTGEIRIRLSNGWELILGHNAQVNVRVGQQVNAGDLLGLTGTANGPHLHLELRVPDPSTPSGWRIVDPAILFGGN